MVKLLENLFVLNERVVLNGRWQYGFFSMIPVGATNVGSIKINFDEVSLCGGITINLHPLAYSTSFLLYPLSYFVTTQALRTNQKEQLPGGTYTEVSYKSMNPSLGGKPLVPGEEMGGFCLGSTVVLVFEAPLDFKFKVEAGQKTQMGQALGEVAV